MIIQNNHWYDILPKDLSTLKPIAGKWLYFGETPKIHALLDDLDRLVESGMIPAAKIARKLPDYDLFPENPCVLCVFTTHEPEEKEQVKHLLKDRLGVSVKVWKSELQTLLDWQEDGILRIRASLTQIRRDIESGWVTDIQAAQKQILVLMQRLQSAIRDIDEPERIAEIYRSSIRTLQRGIEAGLSEQNPTYSGMLSRLDTLEDMTATILAKIGDRESETLTLQQKERARLRKNLTTYFSDTDLREICFDLGLDYQEMPGEDKRMFVVELILHMERRGRLSELISICRQLRPHLSW
jgi:hypothetical protein